MKKLTHIIALVAGGAMTLGATTLTADQQLATADAQVADAQNDKQAILQMYVNDQVKLGEIPTLDLSVASAEEMSAAFAGLVTDEGVALDPQQPNVFEALHDKAVAEGVACH